MSCSLSLSLSLSLPSPPLHPRVRRRVGMQQREMHERCKAGQHGEAVAAAIDAIARRVAQATYGRAIAAAAEKPPASTTAKKRSSGNEEDQRHKEWQRKHKRGDGFNDSRFTAEIWADNGFWGFAGLFLFFLVLGAVGGGNRDLYRCEECSNTTVDGDGVAWRVRPMMKTIETFEKGENVPVVSEAVPDGAAVSTWDGGVGCVTMATRPTSPP